jgi:hypothetical protein
MIISDFERQLYRLLKGSMRRGLDPIAGNFGGRPGQTQISETDLRKALLKLPAD